MPMSESIAGKERTDSGQMTRVRRDRYFFSVNATMRHAPPMSLPSLVYVLERWLGDEFGDDRLCELLGGGLGAAQSRFEGVAKGHELVDLDDDAFLLCCGRERKWCIDNLDFRDIGLCTPCALLHKVAQLGW